MSIALFEIPAMPTVKAQTDTYRTSVEIIGRNVIFLGENVTIQTRSNSTTIQLSILDSDGKQVYSNSVLGNSTTSFKPTTVYGTYTVKATVGESPSETWFWLQDITGLTSASVVSTWSFKNIAYNLSEVSVAGKTSTYNLHVAFEGKSFDVECLAESSRN